ncbi:hypothetical protein DFH07DRAFT_957607 [Mycena maculata]|uniref:Uncharacterized protein n=1 Tax=Mycena maculata TaxID=230809 RepID=A0AAD7NGN2_9AGAR|nr:hypothetical protein DFH07DRAFT_957607 [Mycena maculata]
MATVFTMILKAGLQGFCPDVEGPIQSNYNQLHRHLPVSGFQFLSSSLALGVLEVNAEITDNTELLAHSDDEHSAGGEVRRVREKTGHNPVVIQFFLEELNPEAEKYRKRNVKRGQKEPKARIREDPLLPASDISVVLPPNVPVDWFTPEFYNALTLKERARYVNTSVAFPLEDFVFDEAHDAWKTMGKAEFMEMYGNDVLDQYDIPIQEEIDAIPPSDAEDEEDVEINLEDTDSENEHDEMEVDEELGQ